MGTTDTGVDAALCYRVGRDVAGFFLHHNLRECLAVVFVTLLVNVAIGSCLATLACLCDTRRLARQLRQRLNAKAAAKAAHDAICNRLEILRVHEMNLEEAHFLRQYEARLEVRPNTYIDDGVRRWSKQYSQIKEELAVEKNKMKEAEAKLRLLETRTWTMKMSLWLHAPAGIKWTKARCAVSALGVLLTALMTVPVVVGPFSILAQRHCRSYTSSSTADVLTIICCLAYVCFAVLPAMIALVMISISIADWMHPPCVDCIEAPNTHSEHRINFRGSIAVLGSTSSATTNLTDGYEMVAARPKTPGSPMTPMEDDDSEASASPSGPPGTPTDVRHFNIHTYLRNCSNPDNEIEAFEGGPGNSTICYYKGRPVGTFDDLPEYPEWTEESDSATHPGRCGSPTDTCPIARSPV